MVNLSVLRTLVLFAILITQTTAQACGKTFNESIPFEEIRSPGYDGPPPPFVNCDSWKFNNSNGRTFEVNFTIFSLTDPRTLNSNATCNQTFIEINFDGNIEAYCNEHRPPFLRINASFIEIKLVYGTFNANDKFIFTFEIIPEPTMSPTTTTTTEETTTEAITITTTTAAAVETTTVCMDMEDNCPRWTQFCNINDFVTDNCKLSCGFCTLPTTTPLIASTPEVLSESTVSQMVSTETVTSILPSMDIATLPISSTSQSIMITTSFLPTSPEVLATSSLPTTPQVSAKPFLSTVPEASPTSTLQIALEVSPSSSSSIIAEVLPTTSIQLATVLTQTSSLPITTEVSPTLSLPTIPEVSPTSSLSTTPEVSPTPSLSKTPEVSPTPSLSTTSEVSPTSSLRAIPEVSSSSSIRIKTVVIRTSSLPTTPELSPTSSIQITTEISRTSPLSTTAGVSPTSFLSTSPEIISTLFVSTSPEVTPTSSVATTTSSATTTSTTLTTTAPCNDLNANCVFWKRFCNSNALVAQNCLLTCNRCPGATTQQPATTTTTSIGTTPATTTTVIVPTAGLPSTLFQCTGFPCSGISLDGDWEVTDIANIGTTEGPCVDANDFCPFWTSDCDSNRFVRLNCLFSCGRCPDATTTTTTLAPNPDLPEVTSFVRLRSGSTGTIELVTFNRDAVSQIVGCTCSGVFPSSSFSCQRQYYCIEALVRRVSSSDFTSSSVELFFKHYNGKTKTIRNLVKNQWTGIQEEVFGFCDQIEAKVTMNRSEEDLFDIGQVRISYQRCQRKPFTADE